MDKVSVGLYYDIFTFTITFYYSKEDNHSEQIQYNISINTEWTEIKLTLATPRSCLESWSYLESWSELLARN